MAKTFVLIGVLALALLASAEGNKIRKSLRSSLLAKQNVNIFVDFDGTKAALNEAQALLTKASTHGERTTAVHDVLVANTKRSQKDVLAVLQKSVTPFMKVQSFWITNQIYVHNATRAVVEALAELAPVSAIFEEPTSHISHFLHSKGPSHNGLRKQQQPDWGIAKMRVPEIWEVDGGNSGDGLVIGNIDTGVRGSHELLREKWVGAAGYGWYDPENKTTVPHDVYDHGTHTMGSLVGDGGIGIAPGARWMACKGYKDSGMSEASTFIACGEYMLCPVDFAGNNPDCTKAPHVVSNSWGWTGNETMFTPVLHAWTAAGIVASFSAGNTGPSCVSIYSPADQPGVTAVGATDINEELAYFSSIGPSPTDELKPEISAPGVGIYSASAASDNAYMTASGTSMSCPMATGVFALLKNLDRSLTQSQILDALKQTAVRVLPTGGTCGGISDTEHPNNHAGYGRIDAFEAFKLLQARKH